MELSEWLPDGPAGWAVVAVAVLSLGWWASRSIPRLLFRPFVATRLARGRGWLLKFGGPPEAVFSGEYSGDGTVGSSWDDSPLPGTSLEFLGEYSGFVFHARETSTRETSTGGHPGEPSYRWRPDYVITLATTWKPYDGFFTETASTTITDWRTALYPAFLEWERGIFETLSSAAPSPEDGVRSGHGLVSVECRNARLTKKRLLTGLDSLLARTRGQASPEA